MSPEFGSTCAIFPIDAETLTYLELSGRPPEQIALVEAYAKEQGLWHDEDSEEPTFSDTIELDLAHRRAEPRRAQAPAGPRLAERRQALVPDARCATTSPATASRPTRRTRPSRSPIRPRTRPPTARPGTQPQARRVPASQPAGATATLPHNGTVDDGDARRRELRARPRPRRDRRDHQLHQHLQPVGDDRRGHPRAQRARARPALQAVGQDLARARLEGRHRIPRPRRPDRAARSSSASTSSATAARPASATPARCPRRSPRPSTRPTSRSSRCSRATATSRAASTRT